MRHRYCDISVSFVAIIHSDITDALLGASHRYDCVKCC